MLVNFAMNSFNEEEYSNTLMKINTMFEDIKNYEYYNVDKELIYYFVNCHLLLLNYNNMKKSNKKLRKSKSKLNSKSSNSNDTLNQNFKACLKHFNELFQYISTKDNKYVFVDSTSHQNEHIFWDKWCWIDQENNTNDLIVDFSDINDDFEDCLQFFLWYLFNLRINSKYFNVKYSKMIENVVIRLHQNKDSSTNITNDERVEGMQDVIDADTKTIQNDNLMACANDMITNLGFSEVLDLKLNNDWYQTKQIVIPISYLRKEIRFEHLKI